MSGPIEVFKAHDLVQAYALRAVLEDAGIPVHIGNEHLMEGIGGLASGPTTNPTVMVERSRAEEAQRLISAHLESQKESGDS